MRKRHVTMLAVTLLLATAVEAQSGGQERPVSPFTSLAVQNGIDVYLTQGTQERLRLEAVGCDIEDVTATVENERLSLRRRGGPQLFGSCRITASIDFVTLSAIEASGGSDIRGRNDLRVDRLRVEASGGSDVDIGVESQELEFVVSGGSDVQVRGRTGALKIEASGGSDIAARSLDAERVMLSLSGGCDASVTASAAIEIDASGGSDVSVYGGPAERSVHSDRSSDITWR